jgi:hypothetical protein
MAAYTYNLIFGSSGIQRSDGVVVPADALNTDYQAYQAWTQAGHTATAAATPVVVPQCYLWQLQAVLTSQQWTGVLAAVAALNSPTVSAFTSHGGNLIPADSTTVLALGAAINLTPQQVSDLVAQAAVVSIP